MKPVAPSYCTSSLELKPLPYGPVQPTANLKQALPVQPTANLKWAFPVQPIAKPKRAFQVQTTANPKQYHKHRTKISITDL